MKTIPILGTISSLALALALANPALAYRNSDYAKVVDARPVYQRVAHEVPQQSCHYETVAYRDSRSNSYTGTVVGGLLGAALGHELGNSKRNKDVGAVAGGLLGATIGRDISRNTGSSSVQYRDERICRTDYRTEYSQRLVGYDVTYQYQGRLYQTRTDHHPGDRLAVDVHVQPAHGSYR